MPSAARVRMIVAMPVRLAAPRAKCATPALVSVILLDRVPCLALMYAARERMTVVVPAQSDVARMKNVCQALANQLLLAMPQFVPPTAATNAESVPMIVVMHVK